MDIPGLPPPQNEGACPRKSLSRREFLLAAGTAMLSATTTGVLSDLTTERGKREGSAPTHPKKGIPEPGGEPGLSPRSAKRQGRPPNFVFILTDDHRWDHMSYMGHPFLETPNMDRLAREGVTFNNAFVTTSLCSPSRASFLTGQYAHTHGVQNNLTPWDDRRVTFLELLKSADYRTAFIGKWHMPGKLPQLRGLDRFVTFTIQGGQGQYFDCPLIIDGVETERPGTYITEDLTDFAIDFMRGEKDNPFCLYLSHKAVHHKFLPPEDLKELYQDADLSHLPKEYFSLQTLREGNIWEGALGPMEIHYRNYCETLVSVDRELGRLLDELDRLGLSENTVLVYTSDNGYSWGEHIVNGKRWASEENMRVPMIVRYPANSPEPGRGQNEMVLNIDIAPTFLDLAGVSSPEEMEGRSFKPLLIGEGTPWRESFLYEYFKDFPYNVPAHQAVRTQQYLYIEYEGRRRPALFDIQEDPRTLHNLFDAAAGGDVVHKLQGRLREHLEGVR